jgi:hypothetical protein
MTDMAVMLGLSNENPVSDPPIATIMLGGQHPVRFDPATECRFNSWTSLPQHPNGLMFTAQARTEVALD